MGKLDKFAKASKGLTKQEEIARVNFAMEQQANTAVIKRLNISDIIPNPENDYADDDTEDSIRILADDIFHNGLLHNLVANKNQETGEIILISGERRWRALNLIAKDEERNKDNKWNSVDVKLYYGLTPRQECIRMDAANLQSRGGIRDEQKMRIAVNRYIENLKLEYDISEEAALELAKEISSSSSRTVEVNRSIELNFSKDVKDLIDDGTLAKKWSIALLNFNEEEQKQVADSLKAVRDASYEDEHDKARAIRQVTGRLVDCSDLEGEERKQALEKINVSTVNTAQAVQAIHDDPKPKLSAPVRNSRQEYIRKIDKITESVSRLSVKNKFENMVAFDSVADDTDDRILDSITICIQELTTLHAKLNAAIAYSHIISTGTMPDNTPATQDDIQKARKYKKALLDGTYVPSFGSDSLFEEQEEYYE